MARDDFDYDKQDFSGVAGHKADEPVTVAGVKFLLTDNADAGPAWAMANGQSYALNNLIRNHVAKPSRKVLDEMLRDPRRFSSVNKVLLGNLILKHLDIIEDTTDEGGEDRDFSGAPPASSPPAAKETPSTN